MSSENSHINPPAKKKKRRLKHKFLLFMIVVVFVWWFSNFTLTTTRKTIYADNVSNEIKIAAISDLHAEKYGISNKRIIKRIEKSNPDIVCILGDMYSSTTMNADIVIDLVTKLTKEYPVYFVPGEHDSDEGYLNDLKNAGANVLCYETADIVIGNTNVRLYGIDNAYYSDTFNLENEFEKPDDSVYSILLAHIPNVSAFFDFGADLTLCADTHGGVIQLPFNDGPLYYDGQWIPELSEMYSPDEVYDKGLFQHGDDYLFVTSGIGNYPFPARFNNRPEVAVITVKPE